MSPQQTPGPNAEPQRARFEALEGVAAPAAAFDRAWAGNRLHHAWLLAGPRGIGKAAFAWRVARRLLGATPDGPDLASAPDDPVNRLIAARAHPDLLALERETEDGKPRRNIPVDEARRLPEFFSKAPALAPFRVAILDAADDLNVNSANAVLKTLEEPPPRGVLLLVSHAPGRLLPTLRSRCRRLGFAPWTTGALAALLRARGLDPSHAEAARGSPGRALALAEGGEGASDALASLVDRLPQVDEAQLLKLGEGFRGAEGGERFAELLARLADHLRERLADAAVAGDLRGLDAWARAWERLAALPAEAETLNLDRVDALGSVWAELRAAARVRPLAA